MDASYASIGRRIASEWRRCQSTAFSATIKSIRLGMGRIFSFIETNLTPEGIPLSAELKAGKVPVIPIHCLTNAKDDEFGHAGTKAIAATDHEQGLRRVSRCRAVGAEPL